MGRIWDAFMALSNYTPPNNYREVDTTMQCNSQYMRDAIQNPTYYAGNTIDSFTKSVADSVEGIGRTTDSIIRGIFG